MTSQGLIFLAKRLPGNGTRAVFKNCSSELEVRGEGQNNGHKPSGMRTVEAVMGNQWSAPRLKPIGKLVAKPSEASSLRLNISPSQAGYLGTDMAKDPDRVVPSGALEARHLGTTATVSLFLPSKTFNTNS